MAYTDPATLQKAAGDVITFEEWNAMASNTEFNYQSGPAWRISGTSSGTGSQTVPFTSETYDITNDMDIVTREYTVGTDQGGVHRFAFAGRVTSSGSGDSSLQIQVDPLGVGSFATAHVFGIIQNGTTLDIYGATVCLNLNEGDKVRLYIGNAGSMTWSIQKLENDSQYSDPFFEGELVARSG